MNTLTLILKNMRQRALSTFLTTLSVALGVALAIAVIIVQREGDKLFVQSDFGYNVIVGPKGDELRLVLNSAYGLGTAQSTISYNVYDNLMRNQRQFVRWAVPFMVGDTWQGKRIIATSNRIVGSPELETFRQSLRTAGESVRTLMLQRPKDTDTELTEAAVSAWRSKIPPAIDMLASEIESTLKAAGPLDPELTGRLQELGESVARAKKLFDPAKPAMTDAAGMIANDAVDQLRLLSSFAAPFEYRSGRALELASGRAFHAEKFEGLIGAKVAVKLNMKIGDTFKLEHGGNQNDVHGETWTVVGVLKDTGTAMDEALFIPLTSGWAVPEHTDAMEQMAKIGLTAEEIEKIKADYQANTAAQDAKPAEAHDDHAHDDHDHDAHDDHDHAAHDDHDGHDEHDHATTATSTQPSDGHDDHDDHGLMDAHDDHDAHAGESADEHAGHNHDHAHAYHLHGDRIHLELPEAMRKLSGVFVNARDAHAVMMLQFRYRNQPDGMAVPPAKQMADFFNTFMKGPTYIVLGLAILVTAVAAVSILVSIYNAVSARKREIAILRALGATRGKVLSLICLEAALVGLIGAVIGLLLGHAIAGAGAIYLQRSFGQQLSYYIVSAPEWMYLAGVVVLAALAGLVPASQAYRTSVATNLVSE